MSKDKVFSSKENLTAGQFRYGIVAARFNAHIVDKLLEACVQTLKEKGATEEHVSVLRVPGAFELPLTCQAMAISGDYDAIIALGCVIRGDTPHFDYVCNEAARGISQVSLEQELPVIFGVLTTDTTAQALERADSASDNNKGKDAALAAMEMLHVLSSIG